MSRLIVITDDPVDFHSASIENRNLEWNSVKGTKAILNAIQTVHGNVIYHNSVDSFLANIESYRNDVVFPLLYGTNAPSSKSIIPASCEGYGIRYIGADPYAHAICNDKKLSTLYAREFGINSANSVLLRFHNSFEQETLYSLRPPLIVKPNYGGGSTGIAASNVTHSHGEAYALAKRLHQIHQMPILVEELLEGYEVEYIIVGNPKHILLSAEIKLIMDQEDYFKEKIWSYETKKIDDSNVDFAASDLLSVETKRNMANLFQSFQKIEFMRIDGRIQDGEFFLIELSPDCYLGDDCAVAAAFFSKNYSYEDMFRILIRNSLNPNLSEIPNTQENRLEMEI
jgi:D-alanine-D-alanine ligase